MVANLGRPRVQNPYVYFESYTDQVLSATYPTNAISPIADSTPTNQWNYFCWQPGTCKQIGLNNAFPPVTIDGTANTANAYPIIIIPTAGLYMITAEVTVGIPQVTGTTNSTVVRDILILGKNYGINYIKQNTTPKGWQNTANMYSITNRDNGTQSTSVPPTTCLASAHLNYDGTSDTDADDHTILTIATVAYLNVGDDLTLSLNMDQTLNSNKQNISQKINSVQFQLTSLTGTNAVAQTDASMAVGVNLGVSYSTV